MPSNPPRLGIADVMILVASTGVSLAIYGTIDDGLYGGQRFLFGILRGPWRGLDMARWTDRAAGTLAILLVLFGGWTIALPLLPLRRGRRWWRRLSRQAGMSGCLAAWAGLVTWAVIAGGTIALGAWIERRAGWTRECGPGP